MPMTGFIFQDKYLVRLEKLSDQEVGRLVRALSKYHATGETQELKGRECGYYDFIKADIDEVENAYATKCEKNKKNRQGASTNVNDRQRTLTTVNERPQNINIKEKEKINRVSKETHTAHAQESFARFWSVYPRHTGKQAAEKSFLKLDPDDDLLGIMLQSLAAWSKSDQWTKDGGQYIPHPATWINGRRWEDELPKATGQKRVSAQMYDQREYTETELAAICGEDELMEEARRMRDTG